MVGYGKKWPLEIGLVRVSGMPNRMWGTANSCSSGRETPLQQVAGAVRQITLKCEQVARTNS